MSYIKAKKILLTWANGMLWSDFIKHFATTFEIIPLDRDNGDITNKASMEELIKNTMPDIIINFAAYTNVEEAEDIWKKINFEVNTLWIYTLAKLSAKYAIDLITISTDYVFDGSKKEWYQEDDICNPINSYGMAKYLWEQLATQENPKSIIIRTSRLYGWGKEYIERRDNKGDIELIPRYKNFVNTIINLWTNRDEVKVVNDQFGAPTYTIDLCEAIEKVINNREEYRWKKMHFCNQTKNSGISWFEFAEEICKVAGITTKLTPCSSQEFATKAPRPQCSKLLNGSNIQLKDWKIWLQEYITTLS